MQMGRVVLQLVTNLQKIKSIILVYSAAYAAKGLCSLLTAVYVYLIAATKVLVRSLIKMRFSSAVSVILAMDLRHWDLVTNNAHVRIQLFI